MINFFNRRAVRLTWSLEEQIKVCNRLLEHNIECIVRVNNPANPSRGRGVIGVNQSYANEYRIYVHKNDYEKAQRILGE